jgi:ubiquinone/menaquinone biosynthesis C-methylase UbiE
MNTVNYNRFIAQIYDDSPYFGKARMKEIDKFNGFYLRELDKAPERILEFGSGTGPLTIPLARMGHTIDSVDISSHMHDVIREKLEDEDMEVCERINLIETDAIQFKGAQLYKTIVMPEGILIALADPKQQIDLLYSCNRNLIVGGRFYCDCFQPNYKRIYGKDTTEHTRFRTKTGQLYILSVSFLNDEYTQIQKWNMTYTRISRGVEEEKINVTLEFRYVFYSELLLLLEKCGFKPINIDVSYADHRGFSIIAEKVREL